MMAMQMIEHGGPEVLRQTRLPDPVPGPGEVLIEVEAAAVNFADVMRRRGSRYPFPTGLPFVPGAEVAGRVIALGEGVEGPSVGTAVFATVGRDGSGGYAEMALADARQVIPIPPGLTASQAAGLVVAGGTAALILTEVAPVHAGDTVLVPAAAGGVGSFAVQVAKLKGANVIATAGTSDKRTAAAGLGADHVVDSSAADWPRRVLSLAAGGVDVALEMRGGSSLNMTLAVLAPHGRVVVYGMASGEEARLDDAATTALLYDPALNQSVTAFNLGAWFSLRPDRAAAALTRLIGWVVAGAIRVPAIEELALVRAAEAHRRLEDGQTQGKLILIP